MVTLPKASALPAHRKPLLLPRSTLPKICHRAPALPRPLPGRAQRLVTCASAAAASVAQPAVQEEPTKGFFARFNSWWDYGVEDDGKNLPAPGSLGKLLSTVWTLAKPDWAMLTSAMVFLVLAVMCELAIPNLVSRSIFAVSAGQEASFLTSVQLLTGACVGFAVCASIRGGLFAVLNNRMTRRLRQDVFDILIRQQVSFFDSTDAGTLTSRLTSDCQMVARCISANLNVALRNGLQCLGGLAYLYWTCPQLAACCTAVSAVQWAVTLRYGAFARRTQRAAQDTVAGMSQVAQEAFSLSRIVRTFGSEHLESDRFSQRLRKLYDIGKRTSAGYSLVVLAGGMAHNACKVVALLVGGSMVLAGTLTGEQLTAFVLYVEAISGASLAVCDQWGSVMEAVGAGDRVLGYMDLKPAPQLAAGVVPQQATGQLEFRNIWFKYDTRPDAMALRGVDLVLRPGQLVALVGLSGSGKSTLVSLLQRHYDPTEGRVLIDGYDLREVDAAWFRNQMGVVSQDPRLFSADVASNIAYGAPAPLSQAEIEAAAEAANAHAFIQQLPDGYQTVVTDKLLSGGQRQRIALARALARRPRILVLDEATSALDAESEAQVQEALDQAMARRECTMLVIAHRLSTVKNADVIVVMAHGKIVETGTHEELVARGGMYYDLVKRQGLGVTPQDEDMAPTEFKEDSGTSSGEAGRGSATGEQPPPSLLAQDLSLASVSVDELLEGSGRMLTEAVDHVK